MRLRFSNLLLSFELDTIYVQSESVYYIDKGSCDLFFF